MTCQRCERMVQERNEALNLNAQQAQMIARRDAKIKALQKQIDKSEGDQ